MEKTEFQFKSPDKRINVHGTRWKPRREASRAILILVHGMSEHIDRYDEFATYFAKFGIKVVGCDLPGHGRTGKQAHAMGHFGGENGWQSLTGIVYALYRMQHRNHSALPIFLMGFGMGSVVVRDLLLQHGNDFSGAILCGTGDFSGAAIAMGRFLACVEGLFHAGDAPSRLAVRTMISPLSRAVSGRRTKEDWLCSDPEVIDAYRESDLCGFPPTISSFGELMRAMERIRKPENLQKIPKALPVLFAGGQQDPVSSKGKGVGHVADQFKKAGLEKVGVRLYKNMRHEILNEQGREQVYTELLRWVSYLTD